MKRRSIYIVVSIGVILAMVATVVFNPSFQRSQLLKRVGPAVDLLDIGHVHVTPWSTEFDDLTVHYQGGVFHVDSGRARYGLVSLLVRKLNLRQLTLQGVRADLTGFQPPEQTPVPAADVPPAAPFAGILASLDAGFGVIADQIAVEADVRLPAGQAVTATLTGGGIRPDAAGTLEFDVRLATGNGDDHVAATGTIGVDQLSRGRFNALDTAVRMQASLDSLPATERLALRLRVSPADATAKPATSGDEQPPWVTPEKLDLSVRQVDSDDETRAELELSGAYDGNTGAFAGTYSLTANERLVQPYAAGTALAPARESLSGKLAFDLADLSGEMTVNGELLITELQTTYGSEQLPQRLQMYNDFRVALLPGLRLRIDSLQTAVGQDGERRVLSADVAGGQNIPLDDVNAYLRQDNTLLSFELPDVPLAWLNVFLPDYQITGGSLSGAFDLATDAQGAIHLRPRQPLTVSGLAVSQTGQPLFDSMNVALSPSVSYTGESLSIALADLQVGIHDEMLATANTSVDMPVSGALAGKLAADVRARVYTRRLARLLGATASGPSTLPDSIDVTLRAGLAQHDAGMTLDTLTAAVLTSGGDRLLRASLAQPLAVEQTQGASRLVSPAGELATVNVSDIDLGWFSAFLPDSALAGALQRADFTVAMDDAGIVSVAPARPFRLTNVTLAASGETLLDDVGVAVSPRLSIGNGSLGIRYDDLQLSGGAAELASGSGTLSSGADTLDAEGQLNVDLQGLARQPLIARLLGAQFSAPMRLAADYALTYSGDTVDLSRLSAELFYADGEPRISILANQPVRVRTRLATDVDAAGTALGELTLSIRELTPQPFAELLAAHGLSFRSINGTAVLSSDGRSMQVNTDGPLAVSGITLRDGNDALLEPFSVALDASVDVIGDRLQATLRQMSMTFAQDAATPAVDANAELQLDASDAGVWLSSLTGNIGVALPALLRQPAVMPGNKLTAGALTARLALAPDGRIESTLAVDGLRAGSQALPLRSINTTIAGVVNRDGGFSLTAPVTMAGQSGAGDLEMRATLERGPQANGALAVSGTSKLLYLNDVLNTVNAIAGRQAPAATDRPDTAAVAATEQDSLQVDAQPFWSATGAGVTVDVDVQKLFYTDYFAIDDLVAQAQMLPRQLTLKNLRASFHDSPMVLDGRLDFAPGPAPYDLELHGSVKQLDLATFFRELAPDAKPRAEGLFDFNFDASGQAPNMPQFRNALLFDLTAHSRNGLFRLLDPDSALVSGSSELAGGFGEVVSHVPTGLFGLGAVSRLVRYIKVIEYDTVQVEVVRGESRDVMIRQFVVQSPEVLLTASGGIDSDAGTDILHSPLALDAQLNMRGEGAAIMYDMDLLESGRDAWNYWKGPGLRFWGTPAVVESNLSEVISQAGKGMVIGGLSRPVSGLVGNARHRWSNEKLPALQYDTAATTEAD